MTEDQTLVVATVRDLLRKEFDTARVRQAEASADGFSRAIWTALVELGVGSAALPEGGGVLLAALIAEELGAALCRTPFVPTAIVAARLLAELAHPALDTVTGGREVVAVAEPASGVAARRLPDGWELRGTVPLVPFAHVATRLLLADGDRVFWLPSSVTGLRVAKVPTLDLEPCGRVELDGVRLPLDAELGPVALLERARLAGIAVQAAELAGEAAGALALTVRYLKERVQFDRPIGSFQVLQQRAAALATRVDAARLLAREAAWRIDTGADATGSAHAARALATDTAVACGADAVQMAGGYGFMEEYDMQLYFRRSKAAAAWAGASEDLDLVCERMVDGSA